MAKKSTPELPFIPLGYTGNVSHFWCVRRSCIQSIGPNDIFNPGVLTMLCGSEWLKTHHAFVNKSGVLTVNYKDCGAALMDLCDDKGPYRINAIYGTGVWRDDEDPDCLIVNSGAEIWRTDKASQERVVNRSVYITSRPLSLTPTQQQASIDESMTLLDAFGSWNWRKKSDPFLLLSWLASSSFCGALDWRVHAALTAQPGFGKSTLATFLKDLMGDSVIKAAGSSSEAGLRREMGKDSLIIMVDEAEPEAFKNIEQVMNYLRSSSSGDFDIKAKHGHVGVDTYTVRSIGLISAVHLPAFKDADEGRYIPLTLAGPPENKGKLPEVVAKGKKHANNLGLKLQSRMIYAWPRFRKSQNTIKALLLEETNARLADTLSTVLAAGWCALNDSVITGGEATTLLSTVDFGDEKERQAELAEDTSALDHALDTIVPLGIGDKTERMTLRMALHHAGNGERRADGAIQAYGLRLIEEDGKPRLLINEKSVEFKRLFRDTKWASTNLAVVLKRLPGAYQKRHGSTHIGGKSHRPISLPIDLQAYDIE